MRLEAPLGVGCRQLRDRLLLADNEFQLRNEVDDEGAVGLKRMEQSLAPPAEFGFALAEDRADKPLKSLCQGRVGNIAFELVALARSEQAAWRN